MNRHAFRVVCRQAEPHQPLANYFRQFSTSAHVFAEGGANDSSNNAKGNSAPPSSLRQRSRASANEIRGLAGDKTATAKPSPSGPPSNQPRVVDVKSLPRGGLRGRGGFRGGARGGAAGGGANRFAGAPGGRGGRGGGARGGRGRGGAGAGGRGGRRRGPRKEGEEEEGFGKKDRKPQVDEGDIMEPSELAFQDALRFGEKSTFHPSVTRESLAEHMPPIASASASASAVVHQSLSAIGTADHVGHPAGLPPTMYALDLKEQGIRYFADVESKERTEDYLQQQRADEAKAKAAEEGSSVEVNTDRIISDAEDAIKKVVLDEAVAGKHEAPKFATDPLAVSRNWHLRSGTWGPKQTKAFENKLTSLLNKGGPGKPAGKGAQPKA